MYDTKLLNVETTLFKDKYNSLADDYLNYDKNKNHKVTVCQNDNHQIILTEYCAIIRTNEGQKHLKDYEKSLKIILNRIIVPESTRFKGLRYEASAVDYITKISDVEKFFKGINVETDLVEEYNIQRKAKKMYNPKEMSVEHYTTKYVSEYFSDSRPCYNKEVNFSTGEYYDERIGKVQINICIYHGTYQHFFSNNDVRSDVEKLKDKYFEILTKSFTDEYMQKLC